MGFYLEAYTPDGDSLGRVLNARSLNLEESINSGSTLQFVLNIKDAIELRQILIGAFTEIRLYEERDDEADILHWSGELSIMQKSLGIDTGSVNVYCRDWTKILVHLRLQSDVSYNNTNEGQILFNLLNTAQARANADYGFSAGLNTSTTSRTRKYKRGDDLLKLFINMTQIQNGIDFEVTPLKSVNIYDKMGEDISDSVVFQYGQNIYVYQQNIDYTQMINNMQFEGEGGLLQTAQEPGSQAQYRVRDGFETQYDITDANTALGKAQNAIDTFGVPINSFNISTEPNSFPEYKDFGLGDVVRLVEDVGFDDVDTKVRIYGRSLNIDDDGKVAMNLRISTVL